MPCNGIEEEENQKSLMHPEAQGYEFLPAACRVLMDTVQTKKGQRESVPIVFKASPLLLMTPLRANETVFQYGSGLC